MRRQMLMVLMRRQMLMVLMWGQMKMGSSAQLGWHQMLGWMPVRQRLGWMRGHQIQAWMLQIGTVLGKLHQMLVWRQHQKVLHQTSMMQ